MQVPIETKHPKNYADLGVCGPEAFSVLVPLDLTSPFPSPCSSEPPPFTLMPWGHTTDLWSSESSCLIFIRYPHAGSPWVWRVLVGFAEFKITGGNFIPAYSGAANGHPLREHGHVPWLAALGPV